MPERPKQSACLLTCSFGQVTQVIDSTNTYNLTLIKLPSSHMPFPCTYPPLLSRPCPIGALSPIPLFPIRPSPPKNKEKGGEARDKHGKVFPLSFRKVKYFPPPGLRKLVASGPCFFITFIYFPFPPTPAASRPCPCDVPPALPL